MDSSCRISHFGIKPVSGGSPPSDKRMSGVNEVRTGAFVHAVDRVLIVVALLILNTRNVEKVITR